MEEKTEINKFKKLFKNSYLKIFLILNFLCLLGLILRIITHASCGYSKFRIDLYLIIILLPFIIIYSTMFLEKRRNLLIGRDSTNSFLYAFQACVMKIFLGGILLIIYMSFFSTGCNDIKFGDDFNALTIFMAVIYPFLLASYLIVLILIWIARIISKLIKNYKEKI